MRGRFKDEHRGAVMGLATMAVVGTATLAIGLFVLDLAGVDLYRQAWLAKVGIFGAEPIGIFKADERFGWVHAPSVTGRHRIVPDFDVEYHIDALGHRVVPGASGRDAPVVLFVGGSFTFGEGVEDHEAYPALLQRDWQNLKIVNAAVSGWGTVQALFALERELKIHDSIALVVYAHISHHRQRNYLRRSWLDLLMESEGRRNPFFEIIGSQLVFKGLADPVRNGLPDSHELALRESLITQALLKRMLNISAARAVPFVVVHLPDGSTKTELDILARGVGRDGVIDLRPRVDYNSIHFEHDTHPRPDGHLQIAEALRPLLNARLDPPQP